MLKRILAAALMAPLVALAQTYPSPTYQNVTILGTLTAATPAFTNPVPVASGGTGSATAAGARTNLGIGSIATQNANAVAITGGTITGLSSPLPVASGGTNAASASGTALDNITGFASTGFLTRTGAGTYAFQSLSNGITLGNLATQPANTVLANATASTAGPTAAAVPSCSGATNALGWTSGTGFACNGSINAATLNGATFAAPGAIGGTTPGTATFTALTANTTNPTLTYTASGTGAAARNYSAKFGDVVSVCDYGACSGGNVTTAVNNAIVAACGTGSGNSFGGLITFPPGNYTITTGSLSITQNNCYIVGAGIDATIIVPSGTTGNVFSFTGSQNQGASNFQITYGTAPTSGAAISVAGPNGGYFHDINVSGAFHGVDVIGGAGHVFERMGFIGIVAGSGVGMNFSGSVQADTVRDTTFNAASGSQPAAAIVISNAGGITLDNIDAIHSGTGLIIQPTNSTDVVQWIFAVNAQFDTNSNNGISISTSNASQKVLGVNFVNCWSSSNTSRGVLISGTAGTVDGVRFIGHRAYNNGLNGFNISYGANISINDSDISGNSQSSSGSQAGIVVATSSFSITNTRSGPQAGFANTQSYGIQVASGAYNFYVIQGNNTQGNVTGGISNGGTGGTTSVTGNI